MKYLKVLSFAFLSQIFLKENLFAKKLVYVRVNQEAKTKSDLEEVSKNFQNGKDMETYNSYKEFLEDLKKKPEKFKDTQSLNISGHSTGTGIYEDGKTVGLDDFKSAVLDDKEKSRLPKLENLYAWGCYTGQDCAARKWTDPKLVPNLKTYSGFEQKGPGNTPKEMIQAFAQYEKGNIGDKEISSVLQRSQTSGVVFKPETN